MIKGWTQDQRERQEDEGSAAKGEEAVLTREPPSSPATLSHGKEEEGLLLHAITADVWLTRQSAASDDFFRSSWSAHTSTQVALH